jgi:hypothetical protein
MRGENSCYRGVRKPILLENEEGSDLYYRKYWTKIIETGLH